MNRIRQCLIALAALIFFPLALFAQEVVPDLTHPAVMPLCVLLGPAITAVLQLVKHIPFVGKNVTIISMLASSVLAMSPQLGPHNPTVAQLVMCVLATFGGAVATHRALLKPTENKLADANAALDEADAVAMAHGARRKR